jgi:hypothetical protein
VASQPVLPPDLKSVTSTKTRFAAWHRRDELPASFADLLAEVIKFADPILTAQLTDAATWRPDRRVWE